MGFSAQLACNRLASQQEVKINSNITKLKTLCFVINISQPFMNLIQM